MALSYVLTNGDGVTTNFAIPFSYLDQSHVHVYVSDVEKTFTWINSSTIQVSPAPAAGTLNIEIRRQTPRESALVDYENGSVLFDTDLDTSALQALFIAQEYFEQAENLFPSGHALDSHTDVAVGNSVAKGTMRVYDENSQWKALTAPAEGELLRGKPDDTKGVAWLAKGTDGYTLEVEDAASGKLSWKQGLRKLITTAGDLLYGTASGVAARLGLGTAGKVLVAGASAPSWEYLYHGNPIINGNMEVWQRGTTFTGPTLQYTADRWQILESGPGACDVRRSTNVPSVAQAGVLFNYSLEVDVTGAVADQNGVEGYLRYVLEGSDWRHFAQRQFTISFWVMSTKTGQYGLKFANVNSSTDTTYITSYTINQSNTWEYKTITVPASPASGGIGGWLYLPGTAGLYIKWFMYVGDSVNRAANTSSWTIDDGSYRAVTGQVNGFDSTSNFFRLTGVKMELGSVATPIQFRSFEEEFSRCQRYYQKSFVYVNAPAQGIDLNSAVRMQCAQTGAVALVLPSVPFSQTMQKAPTVTLYNPSAASAQIRNQTNAANCTGSAATAWDSGFDLAATGDAGAVPGNSLRFHWTADAEPT